MRGNAGLSLRIRSARREDVPAIIRMLADDDLGRGRDDVSEPLAQVNFTAFEAIEADNRNILVVAEASDGSILGCLQMTFVPGLSYHGAERALIEDVRVDSRHRGQKVGRKILDWAINEARQRPCCMVELFAHETRSSARRFYLELGFKDCHSGMRLQLT